MFRGLAGDNLVASNRVVLHARALGDATVASEAAAVLEQGEATVTRGVAAVRTGAVGSVWVQRERVGSSAGALTVSGIPGCERPLLNASCGQS